MSLLGGMHRPTCRAYRRWTISRDYLALFESQGFHPDVAESTGDGENVLLSFTAPKTADVFVFDFDTYVQPSAQIGTVGRLAVITDDGPRAAVAFRTVLWP